jgi:hypothetical protein
LRLAQSSVLKCFLFTSQSHKVARMNKYIKTIALLLVLSSAWLTGCERQVQVESSWQENVPRDQSFTRILVVGISPDANIRCEFEHFLATQLRSESVVATPSCSKMSINDPLTLESIDKAVAEEQADAVLATILVARHIEAKEGGMNETRGDAYYKAVGTGYSTGYYGGGFGRYGVPVTYVEFQTAPPITTVSGEVDIATKLFETSGGTEVYKMITKAQDLQSRDQALAKITAPIADRLRRDGLIK